MTATEVRPTYCPPCSREHMPGEVCDGTANQPRPLRPKLLGSATLATVKVALERNDVFIRARIDQAVESGRDATFFEWELERNAQALEEIDG